jgi:hypothetical protein
MENSTDLGDTFEEDRLSVKTWGTVSFYARMRLEIAELMDELDFSVLNTRTKLSGSAKAKSVHHRFELTPIEDFKKVIPVKKPPVKRTVPTPAPTVVSSTVSTPRPVTPPKPDPPKKPKKKTWIRVEDIDSIPNDIVLTTSC